MLIALPPLTPLLVSSTFEAVICCFYGCLGGTPVWVRCLVLRKCFLIYANRSHLLCSRSPYAASAPLSLSLCASQTVCLWLLGECGCRYFGDKIADVFTKEDFQLYRWLKINHAFLFIYYFVPKCDTCHIFKHFNKGSLDTILGTSNVSDSII